MKRFLTILLIVAIVVGGVYFFKAKRLPQNTQEVGVQRVFQTLFAPAVNEEGVVSYEEVDTTENISDTQDMVVQKFREISHTPIAGYTAFSTEKKGSKQKETSVRYVARPNGYVYEVNNGGVPTQISNIFIPNIYEAVFVGKTTVINRFLRDDQSTIASYSLPIPEENPDGSRTQKAGEYLQENIKDLTASADQKLARIVNENGESKVLVSDAFGKNSKEILRSSFLSWTLLWPNKTLYIQTKASAQAPGFLYKIDQSRKRLAKIIGDVNGLTVSISPSGEYVLYSESLGDEFVTKVFSVKTNSSTPLSVRVLPEKCVWLKDETALCAGNSFIQKGTYPDDWYKGVLSFSDNFYRILPSVGYTETLSSGEDFSFDATKLSVNEDFNILYFIDKTTGILWSFDYR